MKKAELAAAIAAKSGLSKKDADAFLRAYSEVVTEELCGRGEVPFPGVGVFRTSERKERGGRNPVTGEKITIPASVVPKFKFSSAVAKALK